MWIILIIIGMVVGLIILVKRANDSASISIEPINREILVYSFNIVGEQSYQKNLKKIAGSKDAISKHYECLAKVISEPTNQYDKDAIKVEINGLIVGYLSRVDAKQLSGKLINKTVPALINGGWLDDDSEGSYGVKLGIKGLNDLL